MPHQRYHPGGIRDLDRQEGWRQSGRHHGGGLAGGTPNLRAELYCARGTLLTHAESIAPIRSLGARCVPEFKASSGLRLSAAPAMGSVTAANGIMHSNRSTNTALRMSRRRGCGRSRSVATTSCTGSSTNRRSGGRRCCSTMPTMPENGPMPPSVRRLLPAPRAFRAARDRWQLVLPDSRRRHRQRRRHVRRPGCLGP